MPQMNELGLINISSLTTICFISLIFFMTSKSFKNKAIQSKATVKYFNLYL